MSDHPDTADRILTAAADLFASHGYAATTTRAIAARAQVNEGTLFRRFGSKAGILQALGRRIAEESAPASISDLTGELPEVLTVLARAEIDSARRNGGLALRLAFDARAVPEVAELVGQGTSANRDALAAYLAERQSRGELRADLDAALLAEAFFALSSSLVMGRQLTGAGQGVPGDDDADTLANQLVQLFLNGAATDR
jgi:AcrR family transcriptional regulator